MEEYNEGDEDCQIEQETFSQQESKYEKNQEENSSGGIQSSSQESSNIIQSNNNKSEYDDNKRLRVQTAPARPLTDFEEFKRSYQFLSLEKIIMIQQKLIQIDYQKYDLDSTEGQKTFKKYLKNIEKFIKVFSICLYYFFIIKNQKKDSGCQISCRKYREKFSKAYKILYKEEELSYLTEIFDSAQEGFPHLYVNGEKYSFSQEVLEYGKQVLVSFYKMQNQIRIVYQNTCQGQIVDSSCEEMKKQLKESLEKFDKNWTLFEKMYVNELMVIETEARRYVQNAINIQKELESLEIREKIKGKFFIYNPEYIKLQQNLCKQICLMNSVANLEGKGRDDLDFEILQQAEGILRKVTNEQSRAVRSLAEQIKANFKNLRSLFKKYEDNIEMVDPQLKNNSELVEALNKYEDSWEKGKDYFLEGKKCSFLIYFSHIIEATGQKYKEFQEQIECRDADIFLNIPCLLVLKLLDKDDKNICNYFLPQMFNKDHKLNLIYQELDNEFQEWKKQYKNNYFYYNFLEKKLLNIDISEIDKIIIEQLQQTNKIVHKIKQLAIEIQRNNPMEWNKFIDVALSQ
ncbi:hypothetical protein IMG5_002330 [Ichthyophthirius multifiliis]|uniref:Uncharacterized protein n=1 Tax=Ichthyophthirius multifiliis TaxID=5932 RepID=G0QJ36_ICHMU|nr:hypothetical protein IMG5_002330 [Ichthyophthirius multifiliis]EGR34760.1 hypothetical protein IMG5_002330 [Ichthyophthirius multifiliis]|eukprot:XP_004040064.1 hypothetical protein IMG5_002330 [Ichthyophthirius multifiliis]